MAKYEALAISSGGRPALSFVVKSTAVKSRRIIVVYNSMKEADVALEFATKNFRLLTDGQLADVLSEIEKQKSLPPDSPLCEF